MVGMACSGRIVAMRGIMPLGRIMITADIKNTALIVTTGGTTGRISSASVGATGGTTGRISSASTVMVTPRVISGCFSPGYTSASGSATNRVGAATILPLSGLAGG
jgi:hypothetical protein